MPMQPTFEEFVGARGRSLLAFALMLCADQHRGEDLVQSVLAKIYPKWSRIAAMERPEAYLKTIMVNEQLRWWRRRSNSELPIAAPESVIATQADPAGAHAERDAVWTLLRELPTRQRAVLVLRYYEDLADSEIASVLGCGESTVRSQASRALATLRAALPTRDREVLS
jgi:RNA polymerase sigma-70 factor (sigma-E family)